MDVLAHSYNKFSLLKVVKQFNLKTSSEAQFFAQITPQPPSALLNEILLENVPLALAIGTEKAKSELIIMPVLVELRKITGHKISIFSGIEFNVDAPIGLKGICDFLISRSEEQYVLRVPLIAVVEAKRGEVESGLGQCAAEMVAAQRFNAQNEVVLPEIWGVVTTGSRWKFLKLVDQTLFIQADETPLEHLALILGLLVKISTT